jgi:flagellin
VSAQGSSAGLQNGDLSINGIAIDPSKSGSDTASTTNQAASAIAKVDTINAKSDQTGVTAKVNTNVAAGAEMTAGASTGTVSLNGVDIDVSTGGLDTTADRDSVISSINAKADQTGVTARDGGDAGGVILEAADGRNIDVSFSGGFDTSANGTMEAAEIAAASSATGLSSGTSYGGYTLTSNDGSDIVIAGGAGTGTGDIANSGLSAGTFSGRESAITSSATNTSVKTEETASTFSSADLTVVANTQINATNNNFEVSVNNADFSDLTLGTNFDSGSGDGQYDDVSQLAAQINDAITNSANDAYASNAAFRDANGDATVTASADGNQLVFTSEAKGEATSVIARTGAGNLEIPTANAVVDGVAAETLEQDSLDFVFDGKNVFDIASTGADLILDVDGTDSTITLAATAYTAEAFAAHVNANLGANAGLIEASVADDGLTVNFTAVAGAGVTAITVDAASEVENTLIQNDVQHLANGDAVITGVAAFTAGIAGANDTFGLSVDGSAAGDIELGSAITANYDIYVAANGTGTDYATDLAAATGGTAEQNAAGLASFLNNALSVQPAGSGVTASSVGDQVVLASDSGGDIVVSTGAANPLGAASAATTATDGDTTIAATAGTATSGNYNVSDGTDGFAAGTFLTADADGAGTDFAAQSNPLVITAGENDTFTIDVDGAGEVNVVIPASSTSQTYNTLTDLAAAIDTAAGAGVSVAVDPADSSKLLFTSATTGAASAVELKDGASGATAKTDGAFAVSGGQTAGALVTQDVEPNVLKTGDLTINGTAISGADAKDDTASDTNAITSDAAASGISVAAAINKSTGETGVTATVNATSVTGGGDNSAATKADVGSTGTIYVNNVETAAVTITGDESRDRQSAIDVINAVSGQTGVTAEDNGESITLTAADGRNISVAIDNKLSENAAAVPSRDSSNFGVSIGLDSGSKEGIGEADISGTAASYANTAGTTNSTVTLTSASAIEVSNGANGSDELAEAGFSAGTFGGGEDGQFLKDLDISTVEGASSAITAIDNAIGQVASQRADLGAIQNRMESTVSNLQVTSENLNAANSRIQDADFAAETAELQRTNVLQQAGISVLAQANAAGQQVLSLLG